MIELYALRALGFLKNIPWQVWLVVAVLVSNPISYCRGVSVGDTQGYERRTAEYEALVAKAQKKAAQGAVEAEKAAQATVNAIEADNKRAREAADSSNDPLKAALDAL